MKRFSQIFLGLSVLVLLAGCAKDNYNKWLTSGTWNLSSFNLETKTVTTRTYSAAAVSNNYTSTDDRTDVLSGGTETYTHMQQYAPNSGATTFSTDITISKNTSTVAFDKSGTYSYSQTSNTVSTQHNTTSTPTGPVINIVSTPATNTNKDDWAWLEDGAVKDQIALGNLGNAVMIKLTKSSMTWTYSPTNTNTTTGTDGVGDYTEVTTTTTTNSWTFGK